MTPFSQAIKNSILNSAKVIDRLTRTQQKGYIHANRFCSMYDVYQFILSADGNSVHTFRLPATYFGLGIPGYWGNRISIYICILLYIRSEDDSNSSKDNRATRKRGRRYGLRSELCCSVCNPPT